MGDWDGGGTVGMQMTGDGGGQDRERAEDAGVERGDGRDPLPGESRQNTCRGWGGGWGWDLGRTPWVGAPVSACEPMSRDGM